jgi:hypothetical protein
MHNRQNRFEEEGLAVSPDGNGSYVWRMRNPHNRFEEEGLAVSPDGNGSYVWRMRNPHNRFQTGSGDISLLHFDLRVAHAYSAQLVRITTGDVHSQHIGLDADLTLCISWYYIL